MLSGLIMYIALHVSLPRVYWAKAGSPEAHLAHQEAVKYLRGVEEQLRQDIALRSGLAMVSEKSSSSLLYKIMGVIAQEGPDIIAFILTFMYLFFMSVIRQSTQH